MSTSTLFKRLDQIEIPTVTFVPEVSSEKVLAWQKARQLEALQVWGNTPIVLLLGFPGKPQPIPVTAAAQFTDRWEVLSQDGITHYLHLGEVVEVPR